VDECRSGAFVGVAAEFAALEPSDPGQPYVLVRAAKAGTRPLRHGRGDSLKLLEPAMADGAFVMSKVTIIPGSQPGPYHLHERANNIYLGLDGVTEIRVAADTVSLGPFDMVFIPAGVPHATHNGSDQPVSLLAIYDRAIHDDFVVVPEDGN
jgi:oxalate decarboxylase/phosphoglucose isomerase-like protein (cupin superfamily)